ncbi:MAG: serine/threonine-protein kinase [Acidobacteriota bacterium]|nr:serine/threonine-protein kinase [Acidobacteriota bacterium]
MTRVSPRRERRAARGVPGFWCRRRSAERPATVARCGCILCRAAMPLSTGTRLGPYEIIAPIGAGGMGEVYRAHDPRLGRKVAIKVSAERFSERFEREARAVAALNHPNICTLYDVGPDYLVMEYIEGEAPKGPLPVEDALLVMRQVAEALEAAHERGIVHRDLKPANIRIKPDGTVKVLDFGLAKAAPPANGDSQNSPTFTMGATQAGVILGTAAYMAPEQARGKPVDKRADIWAFGVVLYELLTGKPLFRGEMLSDILASVIKEEPDVSLAPAEIRPLLKACLEKDPNRRLNSARDMDVLLRREGCESAAPPAGRPRWLAWSGAAFFAFTTALVSFLHYREAPPQKPGVVRFQMPLPAGTSLLSYDSMPFAVSPDGHRLAFVAAGADGVKRVWIRALDRLQVQSVAGAELLGSWGPGLFWSPDSRFLAFASDGRLYKIEGSGGSPQLICDLPGRFVIGGSWNRNDVVVFGTVKGLYRVSASGGATAVPLTHIDHWQGIVTDAFPTFLPDQRHFIYLRRSIRQESLGVFVGSIDAGPKDQNAKIVVSTQASPSVVFPRGDSAGYLLFLSDHTLLAQEFDPRRLEVSGEPIAIADNVAILPTGAAGYFSANGGVLVYRTTPAAESQLTWFDRQGKALATVGTPASYTGLALSPDGKRLAYADQGAAAWLRDDSSRNSGIWVMDLARSSTTRLTFGAGAYRDPVWSADGSHILYSSWSRIFRKASSGASGEEALFEGVDARPAGFSPDGRHLLYHDLEVTTGNDIWIRPSARDGAAIPAAKPVPFAAAGVVGMGRFSPDSRWIAYTSNESGNPEVYVRPFDGSSSTGSPPGSGKWMISRGGGEHPRWRDDGKELFYVSPDGTLMAVALSGGAAFQAGSPKPLFRLASTVTDWDVTADGERFLVPVSHASVNPEAFNVVLNWESVLKK